MKLLITWDEKNFPRAASDHAPPGKQTVKETSRKGSTVVAYGVQRQTRKRKETSPATAVELPVKRQRTKDIAAEGEESAHEHPESGVIPETSDRNGGLQSSTPSSLTLEDQGREFPLTSSKFSGFASLDLEVEYASFG